jgi:hypothetical protein
MRLAMTHFVTIAAVLFVLGWAAIASVQPASAVSAEVAKRCRAMALEKYPYYPPGTGTTNVKGQREVFQKCLESENRKGQQKANSAPR